MGGMHCHASLVCNLMNLVQASKITVDQDTDDRIADSNIKLEKLTT